MCYGLLPYALYSVPLFITLVGPYFMYRIQTCLALNCTLNSQNLLVLIQCTEQSCLRTKNVSLWWYIRITEVAATFRHPMISEVCRDTVELLSFVLGSRVKR